MKMNKTQLKTAVKSIVRECLNERVLKEVAPPGDKAERMVKHVKASLRDTHPDWTDDKIASVAIATAWKAHNRGSVEQDENMDMGGEGGTRGADCDEVVKFVLRKYPGLAHDPVRVTRMTALLYKLYNEHDADQEELKKSVAKFTKPAGSPPDRGDEQDECGTMDQEEGKSEEEESHDSQEEDENKSEEEESKSEEEESVNEAANTLPPNKGAYKVVAPNSPDETEENKALTIQTDPKVNEVAKTLPPNKGQHKTVAPHAYTDAAQNKALTIQSDPKVNEYGLTSEKGPDMRLSSLLKKKKGIAKENHKVQDRSYVTAKDLPQDPHVSKCPHVPGT